MDTAVCNATYQFRIFLDRLETYAIRLEGSEITGVYGPLDYTEVCFSSLPRFPYEEQAEGIAWVKSNLDRFAPCETEYEECTVWI